MRGGTAIYASRGWRYNHVYGYTLSEDDAWIHIEIKYNISDSISADDCIVRIDGEEVLNLPAGTDTKPSSTDTVNGFQLFGG
jgi:hypothetical protein